MVIENNIKRKSNIQQHEVSTNVALTIKGEKVKHEIKKNQIVRILYILGGTGSLVLGIIGIILPGLPTTPFALLSAYLYAKSSKRLYNWLLNNKILGPRIKSYHRKKGVTRKGKIGIIIFMTLMVLFSSFIVIHDLTIRIIILSLGLIGLVTVWFFVPTAIDD